MPPAQSLRYAASLRAFVQYLQNEGFIQHNPALGLRLPVKKAQEPKGLDDAQMPSGPASKRLSRLPGWTK